MRDLFLRHGNTTKKKVKNFFNISGILKFGAGEGYSYGEGMDEFLKFMGIINHPLIATFTAAQGKPAGPSGVISGYVRKHLQRPAQIPVVERRLAP